MKVKPTGPVRPLSSVVTMLLLLGYGHRYWERAEDPADDAGEWDAFAGYVPEAARLWALHEDWLRSEAVRLGVEPELRQWTTQPLYFGEWAILMMTTRPQMFRTSQSYTKDFDPATRRYR